MFRNIESKAIAEAPESILAELLEYLQTRKTTSTQQKIFAPNSLQTMQPYSYLADPNEPAISSDDWEMNQDGEVNNL